MRFAGKQLNLQLRPIIYCEKLTFDIRDVPNNQVEDFVMSAKYGNPGIALPSHLKANLYGPKMMEIMSHIGYPTTPGQSLESFQIQPFYESYYQLVFENKGGLLNSAQRNSKSQWSGTGGNSPKRQKTENSQIKSLFKTDIEPVPLDLISTDRDEEFEDFLYNLMKSDRQVQKTLSIHFKES